MNKKYHHPKLCIGDLVHIVLDPFAVGVIIHERRQGEYIIFWADTKISSHHYDYILRKL